MEFSIFDPYPDEGDVAGTGTGTGTVLDAIQDAIRRETMFSEEWWRLVGQAAELIGAAL